MAIVNGKDSVFEIYDDGVWKFVGCARSFSLNIDSSMLETTVTGSGNKSEFVPQKVSFSGTLEGLVNLELPGGLSLPQLTTFILSGTLCRSRALETDIEGNPYTREFKFYIARVSSVDSFDNVSTFTVEFQGTGAITQIFTPPSTGSNVKRYPAIDEVAPQATGNVVEVEGLGGKDILSVVKDGLGRAELISTGTPVNKQCLYESIGTIGRFTFGIPFEDDEQWYCMYQDM